MKTEYTVKEFANLCHTTARTIKYYEEIGLLKPYKVLQNGYRIYHVSQMDRMSTISLFQNQGYSLQQIKENLSYHNIDQIHQSMLLQEEMIQYQIQQLLEKQKLLKDMIGETDLAIDHNDCFYGEENANKQITTIGKGMQDITINYLQDGFESGIVIDAHSETTTGIFHRAQQDIHNQKAVILYYYDYPSQYHDALHHFIDFCRSEHLKVGNVYMECLIENADTGFYLNKMYMFLQ